MKKVIEGLPKSVPDKKITFSIEVIGNTTGHKYVGDFLIEVPMTRALSQVGVALAKLNSGIPHENLDSGTAYLNNAIAYLTVNLVEAPDWFTSADGIDYGFETLDTNVATYIFNQALDVVEDWKAKLRGKKPAKSTSK
ncbi:MAG: hypothetical protein DRN81_03200 [Thermoproteota archaeon]|nr:MAG: hypothetical protein DRN81_03200 [Candidatus Korarchaeota archaeon]